MPRWLALPLLMAVACVVLAAFVDWAAVFEHEARTQANGGRIAETTLTGVRCWRAALIVAATALVAAPLALMRLCRGEPRRRAEPDPAARRTTWIIVGLVAIGLALRAVRLGESLWYDEIGVLLDYVAFGPGPVVGNYFISSNHIAHTLVTCGSVSLLGANETGMRLPALVFSLAAIPVGFALARRCGLGRTGSLATAALLAVMPVAVLEGVEGRGYSMMIFFSAVATWCLLAAWNGDRPAQWFIYALCVAAGVWSHAMTAWIPLGHGVWLAWRGLAERRPRAAAAALVALALAAILTITLYAPVIPDMLAIRAEFQAIEGDEPTVFGPEGLRALLQLGGAWAWWASIAGLLLVVFGAWSARANAQARRALPAFWIGLPLAVIAVLALDSWLYARFLLFAMPAAAVTIGLGIETLAGRGRPAAALAGIALLAGYATDLVTRPPKQPIADAVRFIAAQDDGAVASIGLPHPVVEFYLNAYDLPSAGRSVLGARLDEMLVHDPAWIIMLYPRIVPRETYRRLEAAGYVESARLHGWVDWNNGDVIVYGKSP